MFIPKRWLVPGALSVVLLAMTMAVALAGFVPGGSPEAVDIAARSPYLDTDLARSMSDPALCEPAAQPASLSLEQQADVMRYLQALEANKTVVVDNATNSGVIAHSQFNDGGFGDIGLQWRDVENSAPITNIHISGEGNITTVVVGDDNVVTVDPAPPADDALPLDPSLVTEPVIETPATPVVDTPPPADSAPVATEVSPA